MFEKSYRESFAFPDYRKNYERDKEFLQKHINIEIWPNLEKKSFDAKEKIILNAKYSDLDKILLDASEIKIKDIKSDHRIKSYEYDGKNILIYFEEKIKKNDDIEIYIEYYSTPRKGLYFIDSDETKGRKYPMIWSQGEDEDNRYWIPSYDFPNQRSSSEIIAHVPKGFYALSNGDLVEKRELENETVYHWRENFPHPVYLISLVIGVFDIMEDEIDGIKLIYLVPKGLGRYMLRTFVNTPDMIRFYDRILGFKYPYSKYAQVIVYDFVVGGMENINATTLTEYTLHDLNMHNEYMSEPLIAHELAHQWFGDYVTCSSWAHIWLNEGFATYMENVYQEHFSGHDSFLYSMYQDEIAYKNEDSERYRRPIVYNVYNSPAEVFDRHAYEKASRVIHMLRYEMGDKEFWGFIKYYLETYGGKSVDTYDFMKLLKEYTGKSFEQFFDQWLFHGGHPKLKIEIKREDKKSKLKIEQIQEDENTVKIFSFPLEIAIYTENGRIIKKIKVDNKFEELELESGNILGISIDPENYILKDIEFSRPPEMIKYLLKNGYTIIERIDAINEAIKMGGKEIIDILKYVALNDNFYGVRIEAINALSKIGTEYSLNALEEIYNKSIGNTNINSKIRVAIAEALGKYYKNEKSLDMLNKILEKEKRPYIISSVLKSIGELRLEKSKDILKKYIDAESTNEIIRNGLLQGLSYFRDDEAINIEMKFTDKKYIMKLRATAAISIGKSGYMKSDVLPILYALLRDENLFVRNGAVEGLLNCGLSDAIPELEYAYLIELDGRLKRRIREAIETIRKGRMFTEEIDNLKRELDDLKRKYYELIEKIDRK
ncbi:MAG: M1 family aminopeptidase [Thermoplasmata archaeon]